MNQTVGMCLPFPITLSACFKNVRGNGRAATDRYTAYKAEAARMILAQGAPKVSGPVVVEVALTAPDRRKRDADNLMKCLFDTLVHNGVIEDDNNRVVVAFSVRWVDEQAPCHVTVRPVCAGTGGRA